MMDSWRCLYLSPLLLHLALSKIGKLHSSYEAFGCGTWNKALVCRTVVNTNASDKHLSVGIRLLRVLITASLSMLLLHLIETHFHSERCLFVTLKIDLISLHSKITIYISTTEYLINSHPILSKSLKYFA